MAPASTVIAHSAVAKGDEPFPALLGHLRRLYPEVYSSTVGMSRAPECREIQIGEGEVLSGGNYSVHSSTKLGAYTGRLENLNPAGINKTGPNLITLYLYTPLVGPTLDPLEYVPSPGRLGYLNEYPSTSTGAYIGGSRRRHPTPPLLYHTHPRMYIHRGGDRETIGVPEDRLAHMLFAHMRMAHM